MLSQIYKLMCDFKYKYHRPAYTADTVLISNNDEGEVFILLVRRGNAPFQGAWALPGGFVNEGETSAEAARRELCEETGVDVTDPEAFALVGVYDTPGRDPRGWTVSAAYAVHVSRMIEARGADDAAEAGWFPVKSLPTLAFDHARIVADVVALIDEAE